MRSKSATTAFEQPIIILGSPRSGTSLVAQIFKAHGVWVGTSRDRDRWNPHGYDENIMLSEARYRMGHGEGLDPELVYELIEADGYTRGPWLVKHSPPTWRSWRQFSPFWVLVRRETEQIIQSRLRCGLWHMTEAEHRIAVMTDYAILDGIETHLGGISVWPQKFLTGNFDELYRVFQYCRLSFDETTAEQCVDPPLWHITGDSEGH